MANAHLSLNDPIHCPIVALSYNYDIKIVSFILLQNQKHVLSVNFTRIFYISDRTTQMDMLYRENSKI